MPQAFTLCRVAANRSDQGAIHSINSFRSPGQDDSVGLGITHIFEAHPPRADGEFDGGLNTRCFSIAQDPVRLARMVNEMRIAVEQVA